MDRKTHPLDMRIVACYGTCEKEMEKNGATAEVQRLVKLQMGLSRGKPHAGRQPLGSTHVMGSSLQFGAADGSVPQADVSQGVTWQDSRNLSEADER